MKVVNEAVVGRPGRGAVRRPDLQGSASPPTDRPAHGAGLSSSAGRVSSTAGRRMNRGKRMTSEKPAGEKRMSGAEAGVRTLGAQGGDRTVGRCGETSLPVGTQKREGG